MADFKATPRNRVLGALSDYLSGARNLGDKVDLPVVGGLGSLLLGKSPEEVDSWSYGDYPMYMPAQGNLPQFKPDRDMQMLDTAGAVPFVRSSARVAASLPAALRHGAEEFAQASFAGSPAIVKPKGGNWLGGLDAVRQSLRNIVPGAYRNAKESVEPLEEGSPHIAQGYKYLDRETGELHRSEDIDPMLYLGDWANNTLAKYMMTDMGTEADPIRALAERGISHGGRWRNDEDMARSFRDDAGYPRYGSAVSPMAKNWEDASDSAIYPRKAGLYTREVTPGDKAAMKENPWLSKLDPEQSVYELNSHPRELGLDHLYDELWNAVRPDSDLPPELRLRPESLQRMGVGNAVQRVHDIGRYRQSLMEKASLAAQNNPAIQLHKEYPEGYKWVQLKQPHYDLNALPKGMKIEEKPYKDYVLKRIVGEDDVPMTGWSGHPGLLPFEEMAQKELARDTEALRKALKYEGDTMGHCVGGYCDDVVSGQSNIYSLRDAKGQPHVTIETAPGGWKKQDLGNLPDPTGQYGSFSELVNARRSGNGDFDTVAEKLAKEYGLEGPPSRIVQIKGKQNQAPIADYLPFVQDFVKSQPWSEVGDFNNTGLMRLSDLSKLHSVMSAAGETPPTYLTKQEMSDLMSKYPEAVPRRPDGTPLPGYARGGSVSYDDAAVGEHMTNLMQELGLGE